jgi:hypothetical protein
VWHLPGRSSLANDYQGREAAFAYFARLGEETGGTLRAGLQHLLADDGDRVVGIQQNTAEREGKHLEDDTVIVFQLKDGRITEDLGAPSRPLRLGRVLVVGRRQANARTPPNCLDSRTDEQREHALGRHQEGRQGDVRVIRGFL